MVCLQRYSRCLHRHKHLFMHTADENRPLPRTVKYSVLPIPGRSYSKHLRPRATRDMHTHRQLRLDYHPQQMSRPHRHPVLSELIRHHHSSSKRLVSPAAARHVRLSRLVHHSVRLVFRRVHRPRRVHRRHVQRPVPRRLEHSLLCCRDTARCSAAVGSSGHTVAVPESVW